MKIKQITTLIAVSVCLAVALSGCTRTTYIPVESVRTEYRDRDVLRFVTDTVRDNHTVWIKGDTVIDYRDRWHTRLVESHDTVCVELTDTVRVPYPVEKKLTRWQQTKMDLGGVAFGVIAVGLCVAVVWIIRKFRR